MLKLLLTLSMALSAFVGSLSPAYDKYYSPTDNPTLVDPTNAFIQLSEAESEEYTNVLSSYTTYFDPTNTNRTTNLRIAMASIDNIILVPGEEFSYNKALGQRTYARGYRSAAVFTSGGVAYQLGGGICQISSQLFNNALESYMTITQRYYHGMFVSYVPGGLDATVYWGSQDFRFKNTLDVPVVIKAVFYESGKCVTSICTKEPVELPKIEIKVKQSGNSYYTYRYINGVQDYYTYSRYR